MPWDVTETWSSKPDGPLNEDPSVGWYTPDGEAAMTIASHVLKGPIDPVGNGFTAYALNTALVTSFTVADSYDMEADLSFIRSGQVYDIFIALEDDGGEFQTGVVIDYNDNDPQDTIRVASSISGVDIQQIVTAAATGVEFTVRIDKRSVGTSQTVRIYINNTLVFSATGTLDQSGASNAMIAIQAAAEIGTSTVPTWSVYAIRLRKPMPSATIQATADVSSSGGLSVTPAVGYWIALNSDIQVTGGVELDLSSFIEVALATVPGAQTITDVITTFYDLRDVGDTVTLTLKDKNGSTLATNTLPGESNDGSILDTAAFLNINAAASLQPFSLRIATNALSGQNNFGTFSASASYTVPAAAGGSPGATAIILGLL